MSEHREPRRPGAYLHHLSAPMFLSVAFTLLPFLRSPIGKEIVRPGSAIVVAGALIFAPPITEAIWFGLQGRPVPAWGHLELSIFALAYLVAAFWIWIKRWRGLSRGEEVHSMETGESWLVARLPIHPEITEQLVMPLAVGLVGYVVKKTFSVELGWWLMLCSVSLAVLARWEYRCLRAQHQSIVDDLIRGRGYETRLDAHEARRSRSF